MSPDPNDRLKDLNDDDLDAIEAELLDAAKAHRIDLEANPNANLPSESVLNSTMDEAAEARLADLNRRADEFVAKFGDHDDDLDEAPLSPADKELASKLDKFEEVAAKARNTQHTRLAKESEKQKSEQSAAVGLGVGMSFMFAMIGLLIVGLGIGYLIDNANGTTVWKGYGAIIGASVGMLFGLYQVNRFQDKL